MEMEKKSKIIGHAYKGLMKLVKMYAYNDSPVLFVGETGVGKELLADLYKESSKRTGEKKTVSCAEFTDELLTSEIFGHKRGAFTGATDATTGLIEACKDGILFLDELGAASLKFQTAILRVTEGHSFRKTGSNKDIPCKTLFIAATNVTKIREDLRNRFRILLVPPLQKFDIPVLAEHFFKGSPKENILQELMKREYAGNVRELKDLCNSWLIERRDMIFSKDKKNFSYLTKIDRLNWDYERFRVEYETWNKYIQPILDKHQLTFFRYRYLPKSERTKRGILLTGHHTFYYPIPTQEGQTIHMPPMIYLIHALLKGEEELDQYWRSKPQKLLPFFIRNLEEQFKENELPYLLEKLNSILDPSHPTASQKPDLLPLLDLHCDDALAVFQNIYYNYHLKKNSGSVPSTAAALGIPVKTLRSRLRKLHNTSK